MKAHKAKFSVLKSQRRAGRVETDDKRERDEILIHLEEQWVGKKTVGAFTVKCGGWFVMKEWENCCNHNKGILIQRPGLRSSSFQSYLPWQHHCSSFLLLCWQSKNPNMLWLPWIPPPTTPPSPNPTSVDYCCVLQLSQRSGEAICLLCHSPLSLTLNPSSVWVAMIEQPVPFFEHRHAHTHTYTHTSRDFLKVVVPHWRSGGLFVPRVTHTDINVTRQQYTHTVPSSPFPLHCESAPRRGPDVVNRIYVI